MVARCFRYVFLQANMMARQFTDETTMLRRLILLFAISALLVGCGNSYEGSWVGEGDYARYVIITVEGSSATVDTYGHVLRDLKTSYDIDADVREGKLVLSSGEWNFVYGISVDEESLECLSDSCKGFFSSGANGMPRVL